MVNSKTKINNNKKKNQTTEGKLRSNSEVRITEAKYKMGILNNV